MLHRKNDWDILLEEKYTRENSHIYTKPVKYTKVEDYATSIIIPREVINAWSETKNTS